MRPKLVSNDRTSGRRTTAKSTASMRITRMVALLLYFRGRWTFAISPSRDRSGSGKTALAERLGARLDATVVLDETDNPFLADFYAGRSGAAFQTQLFFTLARHRQQLQRCARATCSARRRSATTSSSAIASTRSSNLDDNELFIYQRLFDLRRRATCRCPTSSSTSRRRPTC